MSDQKLRGGHRAMATRLIENLKELIRATLLEESKIRASITELKRHKEKISYYDERIQESLEDEDLIRDMEDSSSRNLLIEEHLIMAENCLKGMDTTTNPRAINSSLNFGNVPCVGVKLPTLHLPKFRGNPLEWSHFWDIFNNSIHIRTDLSDAQKFVYLTGQLEGEASELLEGLTTTDANYLEAVNLLRETYGDPKRIIQSHLHALFDLKGPNSTAEELSKFRSSYECHLRGLKVLGTKVDDAGFVFSALLLRKLPPRVRDNINRAARSHYWTLEDFRKAINDEITLLQAMEPDESKCEGKGSIKSSGKTWKRDTKNKSKYRGSTISNLNISTKEGSKDRKSVINCRLCFGKHHLKNCEKFKNPKEKSDRAKELNLCMRCLANTHPTSNCFSQINCDSCQGNHNTVLCYRKLNTESQSVTSTVAASKNSGVALPTSLVRIKGSTRIKTVRALFDQGSQRTFILKETARELGLSPKGNLSLTIDGFNSEGKLKNYEYIDIKLICNNSEIHMIAILVDSLPRRINMPGLAKAVSELKKLNIQLADPNTDDCISDISLLIGSDYYFEFINGHSTYKNISVIHSPFGGMICGKLPSGNVTNEINTNVITVLKVCEYEESTLDSTLEKFWSLESIGINPNELSFKDSEAYEKFKSSVRFENDHYVVSLPWKKDKTKLPHNYKLAKGRLNSVIMQLKRKNLLQNYDELLKDQLKRRFIEVVEENNSEGYYIPHLPVFKNSRTTPLRIVFDCSAGKPNLNNYLLTGPPLSNDLVRILLKFRRDRYACISDIEKAFLNIHLDEEDRDYTRFLWPRDPFKDTNDLVTYRFRVVLFGATCSPFLLNATIKHHLENKSTKLAEQILNGLFMDNLSFTTNTEQSLSEFHNNANLLMKEAGFSLREWISNSDYCNKLFDENGDKMNVTKDVKILGITWNINTDTLQIHQREINIYADTKRKVLQTAASIFDPLGYLLPSTIKARIFMQNLWKLKMGWDTVMSSDLQKEWKIIASKIKESFKLTLPRQVIASSRISLHGFADASSKAYGASVYIVSNNCSHLLMAKAKVAPIKKLTIPQLEMTAALLATRLLHYILNTFDNPYNPNLYLWSDSQVVLQWISSDKILKPYIQNRIQEIKLLLPHIPWGYVPSQSNPSDLLTRGESLCNTRNSELWLHGPDWLCDSSRWPIQKISTDVEVTEELQVSNLVSTDNVSPLFDIGKFSSFKKLIKLTSLIMRFVNNLRKNKSYSKLQKSGQIYHNFSPDEIEAAEMYWIKTEQSIYFSEEINRLKHKSIQTYNLIKQLNLFLDDTNVLRCKKRLDYSDLQYEVKYPILLSNKSHFTKILVRKIHFENHHSGINHLITILRQHYWFPRMRQVVKSFIHPCIICKKISSLPYRTPPVPPLPKDRLTKEFPFSFTGIDYSGSLLVKDGRITKKVYILLFTCANTRAVHLELVDDITTASFIMAFRRFKSRRTLPRCIYSDNALTFAKASNILKRVYDHPDTKSFLSENKIKWKFIPSRAPWYGGFWERLMGMTKNALKKTIGNSLVSKDELSTILTEIECNLNNRPLTHVSDDLNDLAPLTPSNLIYGTIFGFKEQSTDLYGELSERPAFTRRHKYCNKVLSHFWERWMKEYVTSLREFHYHSKGLSPKLGDIIQVREEVPRVRWKLGKIVKLFKGKDDEVRSVEVRTSTGKSIRPIKKLYPLEISEN